MLTRLDSENAEYLLYLALRCATVPDSFAEDVSLLVNRSEGSAHVKSAQHRAQLLADANPDDERLRLAALLLLGACASLSSVVG